MGVFLDYLARRLMAVAHSRAPDFIVGESTNPYLNRWWLVPRNRVLNVYLHQFLRSDDDRALHDHPWVWCSVLLRGRYIEVTRDGARREYAAGSCRFHRATFAHRLEVVRDVGCWTLFITGPRVRTWGFHCPQGWRNWRIFTDPATNGSTIGRGCE